MSSETNKRLKSQEEMRWPVNHRIDPVNARLISYIPADGKIFTFVKPDGSKLFHIEKDQQKINVWVNQEKAAGWKWIDQSEKQELPKCVTEWIKKNMLTKKDSFGVELLASSNVVYGMTSAYSTDKGLVESNWMSAAAALGLSGEIINHEIYQLDTLFDEIKKNKQSGITYFLRPLTSSELPVEHTYKHKTALATRNYYSPGVTVSENVSVSNRTKRLMWIIGTEAFKATVSKSILKPEPATAAAAAAADDDDAAEEPSNKRKKYQSEVMTRTEYLSCLRNKKTGLNTLSKEEVELCIDLVIKPNRENYNELVTRSQSADKDEQVKWILNQPQAMKLYAGKVFSQLLGAISLNIPLFNSGHKNVGHIATQFLPGQEFANHLANYGITFATVEPVNKTAYNLNRNQKWYGSWTFNGSALYCSFEVAQKQGSQIYCVYDEPDPFDQAMFTGGCTNLSRMTVSFGEASEKANEKAELDGVKSKYELFKLSHFDKPGLSIEDRYVAFSEYLRWSSKNEIPAACPVVDDDQRSVTGLGDSSDSSDDEGATAVSQLLDS